MSDGDARREDPSARRLRDRMRRLVKPSDRVAAASLTEETSPPEHTPTLEESLADEPRLVKEAPSRYARLERRLRAMERPGVAPSRQPAAGGFFCDFTGWDSVQHGVGTVLDERGRDNPPLPPLTREAGDETSILTTRFPLEFPHGTWRLREVLRRSGAPLDRLAGDDTQRPFNWNGAAFLDTETTSLSTGSGVYVYLTGVGSFEEDAFVVRQFLMHSPPGEPECFEALRGHLRGFHRLVTFFGKAFDQHRLLDRARCLGIELGLPPDHYDLYWMSRRMVGGRFRNGTLRTMEQELLQYYRMHDLPGSEAPDAYFEALRGEGDERLRGVLLHNLIDVVSLASLAAELTLRWEDPPTLDDRRARGRVHARAGRFDDALADLADLLRPDAPVDDHLELAALWRRVRNDASQRAVLEGAERHHPRDVRLLVELAKWWEHRGRDAVRALDYARRAVEGGGDAAVDHRVARLERKVAGLTGPAAPAPAR